MNLQKDYILVKYLKDEKTLESGIVMVQREDMKEIKTGTVLLISESPKNHSDLKIGDKIHFIHHAGHKLTYNNEDCVIMHEEEVLFVEE